jgi:hypothetical protein
LIKLLEKKLKSLVNITAEKLSAEISATIKIIEMNTEKFTFCSANKLLFLSLERENWLLEAKRQESTKLSYKS